MFRDWARRSSKARCSSTPWRSIRMPFARSVTARRPNAPSRFRNSAKRCEDDVERALELVRLAVREVGEDTALGRLSDEARILDLEHRDHRARRLLDDPRDQPERILGALADGDERDVGRRVGRHRGDVGDLELARDHDMPELLHDFGRGSRVGPVARWRSGRGGLLFDRDSCACVAGFGPILARCAETMTELP